jgi:hypothetical protein
LANAVYLWQKSTARATTTESSSAPARDRPERIVHPGVRVAIGTILGLLLAVSVVLGRRMDHLDQATAFSLATSAMLLVSPLSWGHYYMAGLPACLCVPIWLTRRKMPRLGMISAAVPPILSWCYYLAMPYAGGLGLLGLGTTGWFFCACGLILGTELSAELGTLRFLRSPAVRLMLSSAGEKL